MLPLAILFYQFIAEKNDAIRLIQGEVAQLHQLKVEALNIQQGISSSNSAQRKLSEFEFKKKIDHFDYLAVNSHLLFESNLYTYYLVKLSMTEMPLLYKKLYDLELLYTSESVKFLL